MDKDDLLLAHFQGKLTESEAAIFARLVETDTDFAAQMAALAKARDVFDEEDDLEQDGSEGWARLSAAIDAERFKPANQNSPRRLSLPQVAAVLVASIICWQFLAVPYFTADRTEATMASTAEGEPSLQLVFQPDTTLNEVTRTLYELEGTIIGGPTALGIYRIRFDDDAMLAAALEKLKNRPDLISELLTE